MFEFKDGASGLTFVESVPPMFRNPSQRVSELRISEQLSSNWSFAPGQKHACEVRMVLEWRSVGIPVFCVGLGNGNALIRERDCGRNVLPILFQHLLSILYLNRANDSSQWGHDYHGEYLRGNRFDQSP